VYDAYVGLAGPNHFRHVLRRSLLNAYLNFRKTPSELKDSGQNHIIGMRMAGRER
jgi:hypothetical protein